MIQIINFNSEEELYARLRPALTIKKEECKRLKMNYIKEADIWNYLKHSTWVNSKNLDLNNMVSDILNCDVVAVDNFVKKNLYVARSADLGE